MTKNKERLLFTAILTGSLSVCFAVMFVLISNNDDARLGFKSLMNNIGFNFDLREELGPKPPRIGDKQRDVEDYCGMPKERPRTYETAKAKFLTYEYKNHSRPDCEGTYTFMNGVLESIQRS